MAFRFWIYKNKRDLIVDELPAPSSNTSVNTYTNTNRLQTSHAMRDAGL